MGAGAMGRLKSNTSHVTRPAERCRTASCLPDRQLIGACCTHHWVQVVALTSSRVSEPGGQTWQAQGLVLQRGTQPGGNTHSCGGDISAQYERQSQQLRNHSPTLHLTFYRGKCPCWQLHGSCPSCMPGSPSGGWMQ